MTFLGPLLPTRRRFWFWNRSVDWVLGRRNPAVGGVVPTLILQISNLGFSLFERAFQNNDIRQYQFHGGIQALNLRNSFPGEGFRIARPMFWDLEIGDIHDLIVNDPGPTYNRGETERLLRSFPHLYRHLARGPDDYLFQLYLAFFLFLIAERSR